MNRIFVTKIDHPILQCTLHATECDNQIKIEELRLGCNSSDGQASDSRLAEFKKKILDYLDGIEIDFSTVTLNICHYTEFEQKVINTARAIPRGTTISYNELAIRAGYSGAARAVGSVMRKNRFPIIVPCHRVISKSGKIGGYCGMQKGSMIDLKQKLLNIEGCKNFSHIKTF